MNQAAALRKLNKLFITVRRMKPSMGKREPGIKPKERRYLMEQIREITKLVK